MTNENWSLDNELNLMIKYELSDQELMIIKLIFLAQENRKDYLIKYFSNKDRSILREILVKLQEKGIILKSYKIPNKGETFIPEDVEFNKNFIKSWLQHSGDLGMELFYKYPSFTIINGRSYSIKNITKVFKSLEDFCFAYGKTIKFNQEKHEEIMELLEYAKSTNCINYNICEFIISQKWNEIQYLKDGGENMFNTSELL
jgi:predicted transcriptional regulator